eukprot:Skav205817  [mRNA]  locus=scaffold307:468305:470601:- [translate_table: standard]
MCRRMGPSPRGQEQLRHFDVVLRSCEVQWGSADVVLGLHVGLRCEEHLDHLRVALARWRYRPKAVVRCTAPASRSTKPRTALTSPSCAA